ncbi:MAG TPA: folate-binding protein [Burkholderiaceae bacterium]|nr:folate-binding protein [Burkholderiaceae bacterium]
MSAASGEPSLAIATASASAGDAAQAASLQAFAAAVGGDLREDGYGPAIDFPGAAPAPLQSFVAPLPDYGLLQASGADALRFLQSQLTNDVSALAVGRWIWSGYCTPKGRLLSIFAVWRDDDAVRLTVSRPLAAAMRKRLAMYVLRAKVQWSDRSDELALLGVAGHDAVALAAAHLGVAAPANGESAVRDDAHLLGLAPIDASGTAIARALIAVPAARVAALWSALRDAGVAAAPTARWRLTEVRSGVPRIVPATSEQFVPQALNLDLSGGVSFTKGCYPGQEVVARSHYLGKQKRRMFAAAGAGNAPAPGSDVVPAAGGEPCGRVAIAAADGAGGFECLFESQRAPVDSGGVATAAGQPLRILALPYPLPAA